MGSGAPLSPIPKPPRPVVVPPTPRIVYPVGISLDTWAAQIVQGFPSAFLPILLDPDNWREWGQQVVGNPQMTQYNIPSPYDGAQSPTLGYTDWTEWAQDFVLQVTQATV